MHDVYQNPLVQRYASPAMCQLWGPQRKFSTWRRLWVALAEAQQQLGLDIRTEQIEALRGCIDQIDFDAAAVHERKLRHDVMAHVHALGDQCPESRGIIHLGATSCFVTDNTDLMLLREALEMLRDRLMRVIVELSDFAARHRDLVCLAFTHLQPAQPTTVGKRAALWAQDLTLDLAELQHRLDALRARGAKGTTGTQASFLQLFEGDDEKVVALDQLIAEKMGFDKTYLLTGQTYSRKVDAQVLDCLSGIAQSAHKAATDLRLLAHRKELEEPFEQQQIGSSAMPYKRNPMRSERMCALARFVTSLQSSAAQTASVQWLERSLDDSANRRLVLPQAFLAVDAILILYQNVASALVVHPKVIEKNLLEELPFMATENLLMAAVAAGGDRQDLHERIRQHSLAAGQVVKSQGLPNDLLERLQADPAFASIDYQHALDPSRYAGCASDQVSQFLKKVVAPLVQRYGRGGTRSDDVEV